MSDRLRDLDYKDLLNDEQDMLLGIATIVDPYAFRESVQYDTHDRMYQAKAVRKANDIMLLIKQSKI